MKSLTLLLLAAICLAACTNYGKKVKSGDIEVYYKDGIDVKDAEKTAGMFDRMVQQSGSSGRKSFQLTKEGDTIMLKMVADKEKLAAVKNDDLLYAISNMVSDSVYDGKPVNLILTDTRFKPFRTLAYVKKESFEEKYGTKAVSGKVEVYNKDLDNETAEKLAGFLDNEMNPEMQISFQLTRPPAPNDFFTIKMASSPEKAADITEEALETLSRNISESVFNGAPIVFQLTDLEFKPFRTHNYRTEEFGGGEAPDTTPVNR